MGAPKSKFFRAGQQAGEQGRADLQLKLEGTLEAEFSLSLGPLILLSYGSHMAFKWLDETHHIREDNLFTQSLLILSVDDIENTISQQHSDWYLTQKWVPWLSQVDT